MPRTILILASTPRDMAPLRVAEEVREIEEAIRRSQYRDEHRVVVRLGVRARDLHRMLLEHRPAIVHFAGHGYGEQGVVLEDDRGDPLLVSGSHLAEMLGHFRYEIECVVLNACYSETQLGEIAKYIPAVIGMNAALDDRAAISFAMAFYDSLANGASIVSAYSVACSAVFVNGLAVARVATLIVLPGAMDRVSIELGKLPKTINGSMSDGTLMDRNASAPALLMNEYPSTHLAAYAEWARQKYEYLPMRGLGGLRLDLRLEDVHVPLELMPRERGRFEIGINDDMCACQTLYSEKKQALWPGYGPGVRDGEAGVSSVRQAR